MDDTSANLEGALQGGEPNSQIRLMLLSLDEEKRKGLGCPTSGSKWTEFREGMSLITKYDAPRSVDLQEMII